MTGVPRVASFDDLRVGQWVAFVEPREGNRLTAGVIYERGRHVDAFRLDERWIGRPEIDRGEVVILRDAPEPPVTVRREDYDALVAALGTFARAKSWTQSELNVSVAARALIDNADLGDTP